MLPRLAQEFGLKHEPLALLAEVETHPDVARPMPSTPPVLVARRARGVRPSIVTNGRVDLQTLGVHACSLDGPLDDAVISEEVGQSKPDPRSSALALSHLDVAAADA